MWMKTTLDFGSVTIAQLRADVGVDQLLPDELKGTTNGMMIKMDRYTSR